MDLLSPSQCRAARALLNWSQPDLAARAGVHVQTICGFENETSTPTKTTLAKLTGALEQFGIEFMPGEGLRRNDNYMRRYVGRGQFHQFYNDLYETARTLGGEICLFNGNSEIITYWMGKEFQADYVARMTKIRDRFVFKIIVEHGDNMFFGGAYGTYRWFSPDLFNEKTIYIYGSKTAFVNFDNDTVSVIVIDDPEVATSQRLLFNLAWEHVAEKIPQSR